MYVADAYSLIYTTWNRKNVFGWCKSPKGIKQKSFEEDKLAVMSRPTVDMLKKTKWQNLSIWITRLDNYIKMHLIFFPLYIYL